MKEFNTQLATNDEYSGPASFIIPLELWKKKSNERSLFLRERCYSEIFKTYLGLRLMNKGFKRPSVSI